MSKYEQRAENIEIDFKKLNDKKYIEELSKKSREIEVCSFSSPPKIEYIEEEKHGLFRNENIFMDYRNLIISLFGKDLSLIIFDYDVLFNNPFRFINLQIRIISSKLVNKQPNKQSSSRLDKFLFDLSVEVLKNVYRIEDSYILKKLKNYEGIVSDQVKYGHSLPSGLDRIGKDKRYNIMIWYNDFMLRNGIDIKHYSSHILKSILTRRQKVKRGLRYGNRYKHDIPHLIKSLDCYGYEIMNKVNKLYKDPLKLFGFQKKIRKK